MWNMSDDAWLSACPADDAEARAVLHGSRVGAPVGVLALAAVSVFGFYGFLIAVPLAVVGGCVVVAIDGGVGWLMLVGFPLGLVVGASRRALRAAVPHGRAPEQPGIDVPRAVQPALWRLADRASSAAGIRPPDRVRVAFGSTASAFEDGPLVRGHRVRVLVIPLAYLAVMSPAELAAVVAHEVGHFAAGDTALGRWLYAAGNALRRSVVQLQRSQSILRYPFRWYARAFFRWTARLSRQRELAADAFAVAVCGADAAAGALGRTRQLDGAFQAFWSFELRPALDEGLRPPIADGLRMFLETWPARDDEEEESTDPFATHPTYEARLALILRHFPGWQRVGDTQGAAEPLRDVDALEIDLLNDVADVRARPLTACSWEEVAAHVTPLRWAGALRVRPLPRAATDVSGVGRALLSELEAAEDEHERESIVRSYTSALGVALLASGYTLARLPGRRATLSRGELTLDPFAEIVAVAQGGVSAEEWSEHCDARGFGSVPIPAVAYKDTDEYARPTDLNSHTGDGLTANDWSDSIAGRPAEERATAVNVPRLSFAIDDRDVIRPAILWSAVALALPLAIALVVVPLPASATTGAMIFARVLGVLLFCGAATLWWFHRQTRRHLPTLEINSGGLTVTHRRLLREPLKVPLEDIRVIAVDSGDQASGEDTRFPVYTDGPFDSPRGRAGTPLGWVWPAVRGQTPLYLLVRETPNTLVLLNGSIRGPRVRRETLHGPLNGETLQSFALRVRDPATAARALQETSLMRPLRRSDLTRA